MTTSCVGNRFIAQRALGLRSAVRCPGGEVFIIAETGKADWMVSGFTPFNMEMPQF